MPYLGLLDLTGIQKFLFRNPELKQIADASEHIERLTAKGGLYRVTATNCQVDVVMAAGGNAAFRADNKEAIQAAMRAISRTLLEEGMGLEVIGCIIEVERDQLSTHYREALRELERRKLTQARNTDFVFPGLEAGKPLPTQTKQDAQELPALDNPKAKRPGRAFAGRFDLDDLRFKSHQCCKLLLSCIIWSAACTAFEFTS